MTPPNITVEQVPTAKLRLDPTNVRRHDERNIAAIRVSLEEFGQVRALIVRGSTVVAGNGTLQAARELGWEHIAVSRVPKGWSLAKARAYAIADNRTAELSPGWHDAELLAMLLELAEEPDLLLATGFEDAEVKALLKRVEFDARVQPDEDEVPPLPAKPTTRLGDMWALGEHRLLCGDGLDQANGDRLFGPVGGIVFDPFLGAGSTLIAAEQTGRRCFGVEIEAGYCDVVIRRWENLTGGKAVLL